jgi:pimeloyl-ACP methyl ester carboxylesterase
MKALGEKSAAIVGQDWGTWIAYFSTVMRPDLFRGIFMMCAPPDAWTRVKPSEARARGKQYTNLVFYREYFMRPTTPPEIIGDLRRFLSGLYYSTSGSCSDAERWRWVWDKDESFGDQFTVPKTLPAYSGPAYKSLETNFSNLKEMIKVPGAGHTPPEEKPEAVNEALLRFLSTVG